MHAKLLDNASSKFFLIGFIATKLSVIPMPLLKTILGLTSSICYLIGYAIWLIACHFYPNHAPKKEAWYGFSQLKHQHRITAGLGFIGIAVCLLSFAFPVLLLPGSAIFALSNIVWSVAEYHKRQNPPHDASYSHARQNYYLSYAILSTLVSVISVAALALTLIFPPIGIPALFVSSLLGFVLTVSAFYFLLSPPPINDPKKPKTPAITESTTVINKKLSSCVSNKIIEKTTLSPQHSKNSELMGRDSPLFAVNSANDKNLLQNTTIVPISTPKKVGSTGR